MSEPLGTPDKLRNHRRWVRNQRSEPRKGPPSPSVRWGVRNFEASQLTGLSKSNLSNMAKAGKFEKLEDGSYHTEQFERFIRARGDPGFSVPPGSRGLWFEAPEPEPPPDPLPEADEPDDIVAGVIVHPGYTNGSNGTNGTVEPLDESEIYELERELLVLRVKSERQKLERETIRLYADKGEYVPRSIIAKTVANAVVQFRQASMRVGAEIAPSLTGLDDEYEIKRRVDDAMRAVLRRLQDQINEAMGEA